MEQRNSGSSGLMQMEYQESCRRCRALVFLNPFPVLPHAPPFYLPPVDNLSATSSYLRGILRLILVRTVAISSCGFCRLEH